MSSAKRPHRRGVHPKGRSASEGPAGRENLAREECPRKADGFAVTDKDGTFELKGLPAGKYVVEAWHEEFGTQTMEVEVAQDETKEADFTYEPK